MSSSLEKLYAAFDPQPLRADQPGEHRYVDLDDVRGPGDVVPRLASRIRLSPEPTCQLLAGHRGSGKSTELRRLKRELETGNKRYFVVFCDSSRDIDRNDVDFLEVLTAVMRQMAAQLREHAQISLTPGYFRDRWERIWNLLSSDVSLDSVDLEVGFTKISTTVKASPDARLKLRELIEGDTGNWLLAANDLIGQALLDLNKQGYHGLVVLVDDLDKIVLRPHEKAGCSTGEYLFIHRQPQLSAFMCHTVYTVPLALAYSTQEATLSTLYGGNVPVVPMVKVSNPPPQRGDYQPGIDKCLQIIARRLEDSGAQQTDLFDSDQTRDLLVRLSGGQPTELMYLTREAMITALPITENALKRAARERRKAYVRQLRTEHWTVIDEVRRAGQFTRTADNDQAIRSLLDNRAILQYVNDSDWYGENPVIADLSAPGAR